MGAAARRINDDCRLLLDGLGNIYFVAVDVLAGVTEGVKGHWAPISPFLVKLQESEPDLMEGVM